ncbi:MAG: AAA family ATPase [Bacteroidota bacterium]
MIRAIKFQLPKATEFLKSNLENIRKMDHLSDLITEFIHQFDKKVVLLIDEVDASSNFDPFLSFLGMLRTKYLGRTQAQHRTFHSIVLAGVHDIKSLKFKLRNSTDAQLNSPWNIAIDFNVDMSFNPQEITKMLEQYSEEENVKIEMKTIAERLHYHTSGYPFLVSRLCKIVAEDILPQQAKDKQRYWTLEDIEAAVQVLLKESNTNFDSLISNLENNDGLYDLVSRIILQGEIVPFNQHNPTIYKGILYGVFKRNGRIRIHNRIYEQLIYDYMASKLLTSPDASKRTDNYGGYFLLDNNELDMEAVLRKFQQFMKEQHSKRDFDFIEREWRLVFLSYLKPILNGQGHDFKEVETSEEKRLDIVVTYYQHKYILELKLWRGEKNHQKGLNQLADYLDIHDVNKGYLLIFDTRQKKTYEEQMIQHEGKEIFGVWV